MPRRKDSLPPPENQAILQTEVTATTRNTLTVLAAERGYTMSALIRLVAESLVADPERHLKKIDRNVLGSLFAPIRPPKYLLRSRVEVETRNAVGEIAARYGCTIPALMRSVVEDLVADPKRHLRNIGPNPARQS